MNVFEVLVALLYFLLFIHLLISIQFRDLEHIWYLVLEVICNKKISDGLLRRAEDHELHDNMIIISNPLNDVQLQALVKALLWRSLLSFMAL